MAEQEFQISYFCTNCKAKVPRPLWSESEKAHIGFCPKCKEEIVRRLKVSEKDLLGKKL